MKVQMRYMMRIFLINLLKIQIIKTTEIQIILFLANQKRQKKQEKRILLT